MCKNLHRYLGSVLVFFVLMLYHLIKIASTICLLLRSMPKDIDIDALDREVVPNPARPLP